MDGRKGKDNYEEAKKKGPYQNDPLEVLEQLRSAIRSNDEVFLSQVVESARALGAAFE